MGLVLIENHLRPERHKSKPYSQDHPPRDHLGQCFPVEEGGWQIGNFVYNARAILFRGLEIARLQVEELCRLESKE